MLGSKLEIDKQISFFVLFILMWGSSLTPKTEVSSCTMHWAMQGYSTTNNPDTIPEKMKLLKPTKQR